jgi:hypothetical protein
VGHHEKREARASASSFSKIRGGCSKNIRNLLLSRNKTNILTTPAGSGGNFVAEQYPGIIRAENHPHSRSLGGFGFLTGAFILPSATLSPLQAAKGMKIRYSLGIPETPNTPQ